MKPIIRLLACLAIPLALWACDGGEGEVEDPPPAGDHFPGVDPSASPPAP